MQTLVGIEPMPGHLLRVHRGYIFQNNKFLGVY